MAFLSRRQAGNGACLVADLAWAVLGGVGALGAVIAGIYETDASEINRQTDVAYAASSALERDAARFRLGYCESQLSEQIAVLCDKADFLAASTTENAELPLFPVITREVAPLQGVRVLGTRAEHTDMVEAADAFDVNRLLVSLHEMTPSTPLFPN